MPISSIRRKSLKAFIARWREGYEMVYGQRIDRSTDGPFRRWLTERFYRLFRKFGEIPLPEGAGDFRLMDRKVVLALRKLGERGALLERALCLGGVPLHRVPFEVHERLHGTSKWGLQKLTRFAFDGLSSFSTLPLKLATYLGIGISIFAMTMP